MDDEATREFIIETREGLDLLDREFLALESDPRARDRIATVFRIIHTIKGTSAFLGFSRLEKLTHVGESLLARMRDGTIELTPSVAGLLLAMVDRIRGAIATIEATGAEDSADSTELIGLLSGVSSDDRSSNGLDSFVTPAATTAPRAADPAPVEEPRAASARVPATIAPPTEHAVTTTENVRVDVRLLDGLMDIVGELVLTRNQLLQVGARLEDQAFVSASQRLNRLTTGLQEKVMKTRMQPIGSVWSKLPRVVRDLAVTCGKQVRVEMVGKETELDRTILEAVKDPLTHIVRNAIDHGLEAPATRVGKGKPRTGTLVLRAFHAGGQVNLEVSDDGGGLDLEAISRKAVERKLVTAEQAARLAPYELAQLVFLPGFSTAKQVTNVSGRGVGMDVVKTNIERIGGTVEIVSNPGVGTAVKIRIPLTLAIVPALLVSQSGQRYAIPQTNLVELVRVEGAEINTAIELVHGAPVHRLRGRLLPVVYLSQVFARPPRRHQEELHIVVLQAEDRRFGVVIDDVLDTEEIVVKPLGKELKGVPVFAGATIMGDGRVALILDVHDLARFAGLARDSGARGGLDTAKPHAIVAAGAERQALLLFTMRDNDTVAVPLSVVTRIEEFSLAQLEISDERCVVQHRGGILPLIDLAGIESVPADETLPVIVYGDAERSIGLVVRRILDVVDESVRVEQVGARANLIGSAIVQGKVTDLLDVVEVIRAHAPWFPACKEAA